MTLVVQLRNLCGEKPSYEHWLRSAALVRWSRFSMRKPSTSCGSRSQKTDDRHAIPTPFDPTRHPPPCPLTSRYPPDSPYHSRTPPPDSPDHHRPRPPPLCPTRLRRLPRAAPRRP